jgi:hypothetical protein
MAEELVCEFCGKDDFKRPAGLTQHLLSVGQCRDQHTAAMSQRRSSRSLSALTLAREVAASFRRTTRSQHEVAAAGSSANLDDDDEAHELPNASPRKKRKEEEVPFPMELGDIFDEEVENEDAAGNNDVEVEEADEEADCEKEEVEEDEDELASIFDEDPAETRPSTRMRDRFVSFANPRRFRLPLTKAELSGIRLMDILRRKKAPMNTYKNVFEWHLKEKGILRADESAKAAGKHYIGRDTLLKKLATRYNMTDRAPFVRTIRLPHSKEVVKIPCHRAEDAVERLLTDPRILPEDYCWFKDDPLAPPPKEELDYLADIKTGAAYRETHKVLIKGPNNQLMGGIFYIDGTVTGQFSDLPVTALKFSLDCFTREARMKPHMWVELGWVPPILKAQGRGKKLFKESQHLEAEDIDIFDGEGEDVEGEDETDQDEGVSVIKAQDFHTMLAVILESWVELQETGFIWDLAYKMRRYHDTHWHLFTPMVKCDTEEGDTLSGKLRPRTSNIKQLCRYCHIPTAKGDRYSAKYPYKTQKEIEKLIRGGKLDKLQKISQHPIENAWYKILFNQGNDRGIHGATPSDKTHAIDLGMLKRTREIFFKAVGESAAVAQDIAGLGRLYGKLISHQSDRSMPLTNFSNSIGQGRKMAKEYKGVILLIAAILRSTKGRELVGTKKKFREDHKKDDWLLLVELLLEWEAYLCEPRMLKRHVKRLEKKHRFIMYIMKKVANRTTGMGLKIMKYHVVLHMADDILNFGVPLEFDTGANESHHKASKVAAKMTQRNASTFTQQVAERMFEFYLLDLGLQEVQHDNPIWDYYERNIEESSQDSDSDLSSESSDLSSESSDLSSESSDRSSQSSDRSSQISEESVKTMTESVKTTTDDARISVFYDEEAQENTFQVLSKGKRAKDTLFHPDLIDFLCDLQDKVIDHIPDSTLQIYTRHTRNDQIFHGHPNYRGQGPWKDWVIVDWGRGEGKLPCHINCFVDLQDSNLQGNRLKHGGVDLKDGVYAVVEASSYENNEEEIKKSDLFVPLLKGVEGMVDGVVQGRLFYLADTSAFVKPCCVIPDIGGPPNRYFLIKPRTEWAGLFIKWLERPHAEDDISDEEDEEEVR